MKISLEIIPKAYQISKQVHQKKITRAHAIILLRSEGINNNSAADYVDNFRHLMNGEKFIRTLNGASMDYYFENILKDYGTQKLGLPLRALCKHIEYYENQRERKVRMRNMRVIYEKYLPLSAIPKLITDIDQLKSNIDKIEFYLADATEDERSEAYNLIRRGICFVAYRIGVEIRFAPSRFIGYQNNQLYRYLHMEKDGRQTNKAISRILLSEPSPNLDFEKKYIEYCDLLGITPADKGSFGVARKFWMLELSSDFPSNNDLTGEFPEGKIVERTHKARERNSKVIEIAKENFKSHHGKLFCQICNFDFEKKYGSIGKNFVEGHHTIAVKDMPPGHKTKPEEIAILCANCHRMVHKKRPWLSMNDLKKILRPH